MIRYAQFDNGVGSALVGERELRNLLPNVSNPWHLSDDMLEGMGVIRCEVTNPTIGQFQARGARSVDLSVRPVAITWAVDELPLAQVKQAAKDQVNATRDERVDVGFEFMGNRYQSRPGDRENIAGAVQLATLALMNGFAPSNTFWHGGEQPFMWIREDNELTVMDAATMIAFGQAAAAHKHALIFQARSLKNAVDAAVDVAGVLAALEWVGG